MQDLYFFLQKVTTLAFFGHKRVNRAFFGQKSYDSQLFCTKNLMGNKIGPCSKLLRLHNKIKTGQAWEEFV